MYLKYVQIVNYKNLRKARFEFGKGANTVIGLIWGFEVGGL